MIIRTLHVRRGYRETTPNKKQPFQAIRPIPFVCLQGYWLEAAGFSIGKPVKVQVEPGQLVITLLAQRSLKDLCLPDKT